MLEHYRTLFTSLHTYIDHERWPDMPGFRAPHKPIMCENVIDTRRVTNQVLEGRYACCCFPAHRTCNLPG